jgi:hypothetical protein
MSHIFYSLAVGMLLVINPVHANDETPPSEDRAQPLAREVYTPIFVEFRTNHRECNDETHSHGKEFDGLLFHVDKENQPETVNPYLNLNNESLMQKFWDMALVNTTLFSNAKE